MRSILTTLIALLALALVGHAGEVVKDVDDFTDITSYFYLYDNGLTIPKAELRRNRVCITPFIAVSADLGASFFMSVSKFGKEWLFPVRMHFIITRASGDQVKFTLTCGRFDDGVVKYDGDVLEGGYTSENIAIILHNASYDSEALDAVSFGALGDASSIRVKVVGERITEDVFIDPEAWSAMVVLYTDELSGGLSVSRQGGAGEETNG